MLRVSLFVFLFFVRCDSGTGDKGRGCGHESGKERGVAQVQVQLKKSLVLRQRRGQGWRAKRRNIGDSIVGTQSTQ